MVLLGREYAPQAEAVSSSASVAFKASIWDSGAKMNCPWRWRVIGAFPAKDVFPRFRIVPVGAL